MKELYTKLVEIRKSVEYLQKTEQGKVGVYVDPAVLLSKIRAGMDEKGLLLVPSLVGASVEHISDSTKNNPDAKSFLFRSNMLYTWIDADTGQILDVKWFITGKHLQDPAMAEGASLTYNERYFLMKFFQIPTSKDDPEFFESKTSEKITEDNIKTLSKIISDKGYPKPAVVLAHYAAKIANIPSIEQLPASKFEDAETFFNNMEWAKKNDPPAN